MCVWKIERERERECVCVCVCVYQCACEITRDCSITHPPTRFLTYLLVREREIDRERERESVTAHSLVIIHS